MNNDQITDRLRTVLTAAGLQVNHEHHPGSLTVEFTTCPPLWWTYAQCDAVTAKVFGAPLATPDKFGCHPQGQTPGTIGNLFSTHHDRLHHHWRFRLEAHPESIVLESPVPAEA